MIFVGDFLGHLSFIQNYDMDENKKYFIDITEKYDLEQGYAEMLGRFLLDKSKEIDDDKMTFDPRDPQLLKAYSDTET